MKYKDMMRTNSDRCMTNKKENCEPCQFIMEEQYVLVQYYDIFEKDFAAKDEVD